MYLTDLFKHNHIRILLLKYGTRLIEILIRENSPDCLEILLADSNTLVNTPMEFMRHLPLSFAAEWGYTNCIKVLIKHGAQINLKDENGYTALHNSVCENHIDCVRLLLELGADVNSQIDNSYDYGGYSPLHFTPVYNKINMTKLLLEYGADKTLCTKLGFTVRDIAVEFQCTDIISIL
jgi:ankyrin repeat protein